MSDETLYTFGEPATIAPNAAESLVNVAIGEPSPAGIYTAGDEAPKRKRRPKGSGKRAREKGAAWQAELAKRWRDSGLYPDAASTQGAQARSGRRIGKTPPDVEGTPWWVEAKHTRAANPVGALRQAETERRRAGDDRPCIAVVKPNGDRLVGPVVCMRLDTFEALASGSAKIDITIGKTPCAGNGRTSPQSDAPARAAGSKRPRGVGAPGVRPKTDGGSRHG